MKKKILVVDTYLWKRSLSFLKGLFLQKGCCTVPSLFGTSPPEGRKASTAASPALCYCWGGPLPEWLLNRARVRSKPMVKGFRAGCRNQLLFTSLVWDKTFWALPVVMSGADPERTTLGCLEARGASFGSKKGWLLCVQIPGDPGPVWLQLAVHLSCLRAICRQGNRIIWRPPRGEKAFQTGNTASENTHCVFGDLREHQVKV